MLFSSSSISIVSSKVPFINNEPYPIKKYLVMIDPGHGGLDSGSTGLVIEKDITLETAKALKKLLDSNPHFFTMMTRYGDDFVNLTSRKAFGELFDVDLFFSIHANANEYSNPNISGFQIFVNNKDNPFHNDSYKLANLIKDGFIEEKYHPLRSSGIFYTHYVAIGVDSNGEIIYQKENLNEWEEDNYNIIGDSYRVLTSLNYPAVLIEQGYVTNSYDVENWLKSDEIDKAALLYYKAICEYFNIQT